MSDSSTPTSSHPATFRTGAAPAHDPWLDALRRLARVPEHCAIDCGHALTQRDVVAALTSLAARADALLAQPTLERSR